MTTAPMASDSVTGRRSNRPRLDRGLRRVGRAEVEVQEEPVEVVEELPRDRAVEAEVVADLVDQRLRGLAARADPRGVGARDHEEDEERQRAHDEHDEDRPQQSADDVAAHELRGF